MVHDLWDSHIYTIQNIKYVIVCLTFPIFVFSFLQTMVKSFHIFKVIVYRSSMSGLHK